VKQGGLLQEVQTSLFNRPVQSTRWDLRREQSN
jgi:hypothetical protein